MTNTSRLKILGIGLVLVGLAAYLLPAIWLHLPPGRPFVLIVLGGLFLPIIGLGCYARAKERSAFWAAMGVVPILGPILAVVAIGIDDGLAKRAAPRWVRRVVRVGFALSVPAIFLAIFIPNFLRFGARSPQSEAKNILGGIFVAETSFFGDVERYGTFDEIGFALAGNSHRYTYRIDNSGKPGTVFPAKDGTFTPDNTVIHAGISADGQSFTATATANLDDDPTIDQWHVNDTKRNLQEPDVNDINTRVHGASNA